MTVLIFLLASYGLAFGIQNKVPFLHEKHRFLDALLLCTYCLGFWTGWASWGLSWLIMGHPVFAPVPAEGALYVVQMVAAGLVWAMASTVFCYLAHAAVVWLEESLGQSGGDDA